MWLSFFDYRGLLPTCRCSQPPWTHSPLVRLALLGVNLTGGRRVPSLHLQADPQLHQICLPTGACWTPPPKSLQIPDSTFPNQMSSCCPPSPALGTHAQSPKVPNLALSPCFLPHLHRATNKFCCFSFLIILHRCPFLPYLPRGQL